MSLHALAHTLATFTAGVAICVHILVVLVRGIAISICFIDRTKLDLVFTHYKKKKKKEKLDHKLNCHSQETKVNFISVNYSLMPCIYLPSLLSAWNSLFKAASSEKYGTGNFRPVWAAKQLP